MCLKLCAVSSCFEIMAQKYKKFWKDTNICLVLLEKSCIFAEVFKVKNILAFSLYINKVGNFRWNQKQRGVNSIPLECM